jgi:TolB protein
VSADRADLNALALRAFSSHGRYRLVASGYVYDLRFSLVSPNTVRVEVTRGPERSSVLAASVPGTNARNALLRAADLAVTQTNGMGLRGFFASKLVFIGQGTGRKEVYVGDLFFTEVRRITSDRAIALAPRWSPDGQKVLYTSFLHGFPDIFLLDLATYQRITFESFRGTNSGAHFSPDGRHVAMVLTGSGSPEIWISDGQGHGLSRRTHSESTKSSPCWSPDGTRIVFAQEPGPQLYVISAAGGLPRRITSGISTYCAEPDWSRAAPNKIAFTARIGGRYQIAVFDSARGASEQVSKAPFDGIEPCWLPDGRHLVYSARSAATSRLCILDTETGKSTPVSPTSFGSALQGNVWPR